MSLVILMSTYNGEKYLSEQLDSLVNQELKPDRIVARDDGSSDSTISILDEYCKKYRFIRYFQGNNLRPAKSFFELINKVNGYDYYALCDQDDVWLQDKLKVAVDTLKKEDNSIPLLYCCRTTLTDENLNPIDSNISKLYSFTDFSHALLYQTAPGCTFVFNQKARDLIVKYDLDKEFNIIHDSIIHKVVTMFGKMILDEESHMLYRQHGNNEIGLSANIFTTTFKRIKRVFTSELKNYRRDTAKSLLNVYGDICDEEKRHLLEVVANYENNKEYRKELLNNECFKTHTINDLFFKILVLINYI